MVVGACARVLAGMILRNSQLLTVPETVLISICREIAELWKREKGIRIYLLGQEREGVDRSDTIE